MKKLYFAIIYSCNQKCLGCPCGKNAFKGQNLTLDDIKQTIEALLPNNEPISLTLSGGEPLLHPQLFAILDYLKEKNIYVTILSNAEKLSDVKFAYELSKHLDKQRARIITTIHSSDPLVHQQQNGSKDSFNKSINGLINLHYFGIKVIIKHCITALNYQDTKNFIELMSNLFDPSVDFELWSIDYCGLNKEEAQKLYINYQDLKPYLEEALDYYIKTKESYNRRLTLNNIPLCWVDPYYWSLFDLSSTYQEYDSYSDPKIKLKKVETNFGKLSSRCKKCDVNNLCKGAYKTLFNYFGNDVVKQIEAIKEN